jgi:hypothetical protein
MGQAVNELFIPVPCAANATVTLGAGPCGFGSFYCTTAGTFTLQDNSGNTIIPAVALAVGATVPGGYQCFNGAKVVLSGGCAGVASYTPIYE